jgi:tRNA(Ile)-lysidine synthase
LIRPLLDVTRGSVRDWLTARGIAWRDDSSNRDPMLRRNRIRLELLPALERDWNRALTETLARLGEIAAAEESWWHSEVVKTAAGVIRDSHDGLLLSVPRLVELHPALGRRVLRFAVELAKGDTRRTTFGHIEALYSLAARSGAGKTQLPGLEACRSFEWIRLARPGGPVAVSAVSLAVPGSISLADGTILQLDLVPAPLSRLADSRYTDTGNHLDWDLVKDRVCLRPWSPGDRYRPLAANREEKLKDLFQRARVPLWKRHGWPIIASGGVIVWARQFGVAAAFAVTEATRAALRVAELAPSPEPIE